MKQHPSRTRSQRPLLTWLSVLLIAAACQGTAHVREASPAAFPTEEPAEPAQPSDAQRFATPPDHDLSGADARDAPSAEPRVAPNASEPELDLGAAPPADATAVGRTEAKASSGERSRGADDRRVDSARREAPAPDGSTAWRRPLPEQRPGLATHWGEDRHSPAREVNFERAEPARPSVLVELHYNDGTGARRMLPDGSWARAEKRLPSGMTVRVVDSEGQTLPALVGGGRVIAVGAPGERYALAIENPTSRRFEVVASVDGLDVLDGQAARVDKRGYLVAAYSSVSIDGFRRSDEEVAAFRLGNVARSYAASKGQARNVGVLGFAFFDERRPPVPEPTAPWYRPASEDTRLRRQADPFPGYAQPPVW